jgi:hypothetical protein
VEKVSDGFQIATQPRIRKLSVRIWERGLSFILCTKSQPSKRQTERMATPTTSESRSALNSSPISLETAPTSKVKIIFDGACNNGCRSLQKLVRRQMDHNFQLEYSPVILGNAILSFQTLRRKSENTARKRQKRIGSGGHGSCRSLFRPLFLPRRSAFA